MKRDMDLVRSILLAVDEAPVAALNELPPITGATADQVAYHVEMMIEARYLTGESWSDKEEATFFDISLTWSGHDFLDTIRDPELWRKTKEGAGKVGSWGVKLLADLAVGYAKAKAHDLGLPIG